MTELLPEKFTERLRLDLGDAEAQALCAALDSEPPVSIRLNSIKVLRGVSDDDDATTKMESILPVLQGAKPIPWSLDGYYLPQRPQFTFDSDFHAGAYYVQEAGSQFVGHILETVNLHERRVLDMCAAPGGKTTLYASLVGRDGLVVANEIDRRRAQILADNVRKWGLGNVAVTVCEPKQMAAFASWFDVVTVDAPCSGEGMFRKDEGARSDWNEGNVRACALRQADILREGWRALKPGGVLIYSTCTFNRAENEQTLETFEQEMDGEVVRSHDVAVEPAWGIVCGEVGAFQTFRFYPHKTQGEGFFAAVACKSPDASGRVRTPRGQRPVFANVTREEARELSRWVEDPKSMHFLRVGDICYGYTAAQVEAVRTVAEAVPVICSGVEMGQVFKGTLKPSHALALYAGLNRDYVSAVELDDNQVQAYLRRQDIDAEPLTEGINLILSRGEAIGFAKRIGNRVNNLYPNTLRILKN